MIFDNELELSEFLFKKEQEDVKKKTYWIKGYKNTFVHNNLKKIKRLLSKTKDSEIKKRMNLVLWLYYQHSFQSIISTRYGNLKKYDVFLARKYMKKMYDHYLGYWGRNNMENIFPILSMHFINKDIKKFDSTLKRSKDKSWNRSILVKKMRLHIT